MSNLPARISETETALSQMVTWFHGILRHPPLNFRDVQGVELGLEDIDAYLWHLESNYDAERNTPAAVMLAAHIDVLFQLVHLRLAETWISDAIRESALQEMQAVHERFIGPIPESSPVVVFEFNRSIPFPEPINGFAESHRCWSGTHFLTAGIAYSLTVVSAPLWAHELIRLLLEESSRTGGEMRRLYRFELGFDDSQVLLGEPVPAPSSEVLEAAIALWCPDVPGAPLASLREAVQCATSL